MILKSELSKRVSSEGSEEVADPAAVKLFEDSDDEADEASRPSDDEGVLLKGNDKAAKDDIECDKLFHQINVDGAAYTTYRAVLFYLSTNFISFASLRSSLDAEAKSLSKLSVTSGDNPSTTTTHLVSPSSPKSIYRLADLLQLPALRPLALDALKTSLTPHNILTELFSNNSIAYPEVADVMVQSAASMWEELRQEAMKELEERLEKRTAELPAVVVWKLKKLLKGV